MIKNGENKEVLYFEESVPHLALRTQNEILVTYTNARWKCMGGQCSGKGRKWDMHHDRKEAVVIRNNLTCVARAGRSCCAVSWEQYKYTAIFEYKSKSYLQ